MACRLTYRCIENSSLWEEDQSNEDIGYSLQPSHVLGMVRIRSKRKPRSVDNIESSVDDITQYARVQIHAQSYIHSVAGEGNADILAFVPGVSRGMPSIESLPLPDMGIQPATVCISNQPNMTSSKLYICPGCGISFTQFANMERHRRSVHRSPFIKRCNVQGCHRGFGRREKLMDHMKRMHPQTDDGLYHYKVSHDYGLGVGIEKCRPLVG